MTSEFLLQAVGLLDDDLIVQAERPPARRQLPWRQWAGLCACLALVIVLGRAAVHNLAGGSTSAGAGASTSAGASAGASASPGPSGEGSSASAGTAGEPAYVLLDGQSYTDTGETAAQLPRGAEEAGVLSLVGEGVPGPSTNGAEYVGCTLFEGADGLLYVRLPQGGYAVFMLAQPEP